MSGKEEKTGKRSSSFEDELKRLEEIVRDLESEKVTLEKALRLFEEGSKIAKSAEKKLRASQVKVREVLGEEDGRLVTEDFLPTEGEEEPDDED